MSETINGDTPERVPTSRDRMIGFVTVSFSPDELPPENDRELGRWYEKSLALHTSTIDSPNRVDVLTMIDDELVSYYRIAYLLDGRLPPAAGRSYESGEYNWLTKTLLFKDTGALSAGEFSVFAGSTRGRQLKLDNPEAYVDWQVTQLDNARASNLLTPIAQPRRPA